MIAAVSLYSHGEVAWLNSLTEDEAVELTADPKGSLRNATDSPTGGIGTSVDCGDYPLSLIAKWVDVQAARKRCKIARDTLQMSQLIAQGVSARQIAVMFGTHHQAVNRRIGVALHLIVADLNNGLLAPEDRKSHVDLCLSCGTRPRARLRATRRRVVGGWEVVKSERQSSVCAECLRPELQFRLMPSIRPELPTLVVA